MSAIRRVRKISRLTYNALTVLEDRSNDIEAFKGVLRELIDKIDDLDDDMVDVFVGNTDVIASNIVSAHILPTSDRSLALGQLWNNRGVLNIKS
tara:strand:- start:5027 stop:5308 length:282 start_codon:yes stop_codon:yes gene_type:complete